MLWSVNDLVGYGLNATDGAIGTVDDILFDDRDWVVRWLVADTGSWLPGRKVLLPPECFSEPDSLSREIPVGLTRQRIEGSPGIDSDRPVSRQAETNLYGYYGYPPYWSGVYGGPVAGAAATMPLTATGTAPLGGARSAQEPGGIAGEGVPKGDPHLRSANEVIGYYIQATDDDIGHVEDILIDMGTWAARYLMVDTRNWWPGRKVLISPDWASSVSWDNRKVYVDVTRERVRNSPEYDPARPIDRGYEDRLHSYYGYGRD